MKKRNNADQRRNGGRTDKTCFRRTLQQLILKKMIDYNPKGEQLLHLRLYIDIRILHTHT